MGSGCGGGRDCVEGSVGTGPTPARCARTRDSVLWEQRCGAVTRRQTDDVPKPGLGCALRLSASPCHCGFSFAMRVLGPECAVEPRNAFSAKAFYRSDGYMRS